MSLQVQALKTEIFHARQDLGKFLLENLKPFSNENLENSILVVTSKILSLAEARLRPDHENKLDLIREEADQYLGEIGQACHLTIKHGLLMVGAGIDLSNSETQDYILLPQDPFASADKICREIKSTRKLKNFGILISDSRTLPLRKGVLGCGLAYAGFLAIKNLIGEKDLFARKLKMTQVNLLDALAGSAVMMMGEGAEQQPLALLRGAPVQFTDEKTENEIVIEATEDLYYPMYRDLILKNKEKK